MLPLTSRKENLFFNFTLSLLLDKFAVSLSVRLGSLSVWRVLYELALLPFVDEFNFVACYYSRAKYLLSPKTPKSGAWESRSILMCVVTIVERNSLRVNYP